MVGLQATEGDDCVTAGRNDARDVVLQFPEFVAPTADGDEVVELQVSTGFNTFTFEGAFQPCRAIERGRTASQINSRNIGKPSLNRWDRCCSSCLSRVLADSQRMT